MSIVNRPPDSINESDLLSLVTNKVPEDKTLEYKQALPGNQPDQKKEFLADVSSLANASGGLLILGIREQAGIAIDVCGTESSNLDAEVRRLENIIRDGIEPRISGTCVWPVPLKNGRSVVIIKVPKSWSGPHMVSLELRGFERFFSRNSRGKYPLDVAELRAAFLLSETTTERIRGFRTERLGKIIAGETPIPLAPGWKLVLHIIPISAFDPAHRFDLSCLNKSQDFLSMIDPMNGNRSYSHPNFDGFLTYGGPAEPKKRTYLQIFRNGCIEAVETSFYRPPEREVPILGPFEPQVIEALPRYLKLQKSFGVQLPIFVFLTLQGVSGYPIDVGPRFSFSVERPLIDRDVLQTSPVLIESFDVDPSTAMKPCFDEIWNAGGFPHSMNIDTKGKWIGSQGI